VGGGKDKKIDHLVRGKGVKLAAGRGGIVPNQIKLKITFTLCRESRGKKREIVVCEKFKRRKHGPRFPPGGGTKELTDGRV